MLHLLNSAKTVVKNLVQSPLWSDRPEKINFEITAACDSRCIHCPRLDMDRPMKVMNMSLFRRLIDQASELGVPYLCPNGYGEICTIPVPMLEEYFDYIASKDRHFKILVNTNGNRMFEECSALFIKHGVHLVNVTIDGATAATAESIRKNLNFDQIETNVKNLLSMRDSAGSKYPKVRVGMVAMAQTIPEIGSFLERWRGVADYVGIGGFSNRLSSIEKSEESKPLMPSSVCVLPFSDLNIWSDGKAVLCCEDWNEELVIGDLNSQTLLEIWHSPQIKEVRGKHIAKAGHDISLCAKCNNWQPPGWGTRLWV
jgi:Iron-sulfur cluster-binding domain